MRLDLSYIIGKTFTGYYEVKRTFHSINVYKASKIMSSPEVFSVYNYILNDS